MSYTFVRLVYLIRDSTESVRSNWILTGKESDYIWQFAREAYPIFSAVVYKPMAAGLGTTAFNSVFVSSGSVN